MVEVTLERIAGPSVLDFLFGSKMHAYIQNLAVLVDERRKGAASRLVKRCEATAILWGYAEVYLHVDEENPGALALYKSLGYQIVRRESFWKKFINEASLVLLHKKLAFTQEELEHLLDNME